MWSGLVMGEATINQVVFGDRLPVRSLLLVNLVGVAPDQAYQHLQLVLGRLVAHLLPERALRPRCSPSPRALRPRSHRLLCARRRGPASLLKVIDASEMRVQGGGHRVEVKVGGQRRRLRRERFTERERLTMRAGGRGGREPRSCCLSTEGGARRWRSSSDASLRRRTSPQPLPKTRTDKSRMWNETFSRSRGSKNDPLPETGMTPHPRFGAFQRDVQVMSPSSKKKPRTRFENRLGKWKPNRPKWTNSRRISRSSSPSLQLSTPEAYFF